MVDWTKMPVEAVEQKREARSGKNWPATHLIVSEVSVAEKKMTGPAGE